MATNWDKVNGGGRGKGQRSFTGCLREVSWFSLHISASYFFIAEVISLSQNFFFKEKS